MRLKSQSRAARNAYYRVLWAMFLSLAFHAQALYFAQWFLHVPRSPPRQHVLQAQLMPPIEESAIEIDDPVLKNTIDELPEEAAPRPSKKAVPAERRPEQLSERKLEQVLKKLSEGVFYPPEAVAQGWEGETILLVDLDARGRIEKISVASSSGYAILDEAAMRALGARRTLGPDLQGKSVFVPIRFELN